MNLTDLQRRTARAIVSLFETGKPIGGYGRVVLTPGDRGGLSVGSHQATRASGNLGLLLKAYCERVDAEYDDELRPYVDRALDGDAALDTDDHFASLLRIAATDPAMREAQDEFFDRLFLDPAIRECKRLGFETALAATVLFDSFIHGSYAKIRNRVPTLPERDWCFTYLAKRKAWLEKSTNPSLPPTVYRPVTLYHLAASGAWALPLPLTVRGVQITGELLRGETPARASAETARVLRRRVPPMGGDDVRELQRALFATVDGWYGIGTEAAVRVFQASVGLKVDGIVGPATRAALGL